MWAQQSMMQSVSIEFARDFVFVDDVVQACMLAIKKDMFGVSNVGTGKSYCFNVQLNNLW